jgi:hypothetical protein
LEKEKKIIEAKSPQPNTKKAKMVGLAHVVDQN